MKTRQLRILFIYFYLDLNLNTNNTRLSYGKFNSLNKYCRNISFSDKKDIYDAKF